MRDASWRWRTVEHTADLAIEVEAPTLRELFTGGGHGLVGALRGEEAGEAPAAGRASAWRELALEASDREALLVEWLRELLYLYVSEGLLFVAAEVDELGETRMVARAGLAAAACEGGARELKGVTYHDLEVSQRDGGWYARIVFDV